MYYIHDLGHKMDVGLTTNLADACKIVVQRGYTTLGFIFVNYEKGAHHGG